MQGLQFTADLLDCRGEARLLTDAGALRALCVSAVAEAGLSPVGELFHHFAQGADGSGQGGVTGVVLLAESHLAVHTWPESGGVTIDAYVCHFSGDNSARAERLVSRLIAAFEPQRAQRQQWRRGLDP